MADRVRDVSRRVPDGAFRSGIRAAGRLTVLGVQAERVRRAGVHDESVPVKGSAIQLCYLVSAICY